VDEGRKRVLLIAAAIFGKPESWLHNPQIAYRNQLRHLRRNPVCKSDDSH
jgi:hypothetical protein